ncbi:Na+ dependent nucleoside transporter C-terminus-domain-containing protein [Chytriomyces sp. MP71]|nr:Na+ dependent nucleoside transporter C-terminus-domain-containing protein [Chytriomyces sp. MP71]
MESKPFDIAELAAAPQQDADKKTFGKRPLKIALLHLAIWLPLTAFIIALIINGRNRPNDSGYEFAIVVYAFITLRLLAQHVSMSKLVYNPLGRLFDTLFGWIPRAIPIYLHMPIGGLLYLVVLLVTACASPVTPVGTIPQRIQSIIGLIIFTAVLYATSANGAAINWRTVVVGYFLQFFIALFILKTQIGVNIFNFLSSLIAKFLEESQAGLAFVLGPKNQNPFANTWAVAVLPAIIFFCSFISIVYYLGGMQYIVGKFGWLMVRLMDTSGAESVVAAASPFIGQGESALLVRPFIAYMTRSEIHAAMTSGFATISGSVLLAYVNYTGNSPAATATILASCLMSMPGSLVVSKLRIPEEELSITKGYVKVPESEEKDANLLDAASKGAATGVQLALLIAGSLLAILSLFQVCNDLVSWAFWMVNIPNWIDSTKGVSIQLLLSYLFYPISLCIGIPFDSARKGAEFMATKIVVNEFAAYADLSTFAYSNATLPDGSHPLNGALDARTVRLLTLALCGFANIGSVGVQLSIFSVIAPTRKKDFAELALSAMITGAMSTWVSAALAGAIL